MKQHLNLDGFKSVYLYDYIKHALICGINSTK
ncbi:hypothetical protein MUGA111182_10720 [Mucilaginibacter galii]